MKTYYFIRHGASEIDVGNARVRDFRDETHPWVDWPLSEPGKAQAARVGERLKRLDAQRVLSSALSRSVQTAEVAARVSCIPYGGGWKELNEVVMGRVRGRQPPPPARERDSRRSPPGRLRRPLWPLFYRALTVGYLILWRTGRTEGGESLAQVEERIRDVLVRLDGLPEERIAVVGHGYWILCMAAFLSRAGGRRLPPFPPGGWVSNVSFTTVRTSRDGWELEGFAVPIDQVAR